MINLFPEEVDELVAHYNNEIALAGDDDPGYVSWARARVSYLLKHKAQGVMSSAQKRKT